MEEFRVVPVDRRGGARFSARAVAGCGRTQEARQVRQPDRADAHRDIRALETEFDTRANLAQLEKWNGDTLRLAAPAAGQFVSDAGALASMDVRQGGATVQMASLVVPTLSDGAVVRAVPAVATAMVNAPAAMAEPSAEPSIAGAVAQVRDRAIERGKVQAVALLDRKLLSDSTIGDLLNGARAEASRTH